MNKLCIRLLVAASIAGTLISTLTWAQQRGGRHHHHNHHNHSHARVGVYVGAPLFWSPFWYPYPYPYYYPYSTVVVQPAGPIVYVEKADTTQSAAPAPQAPQQYWHYCADSSTYYPYVNTCASPWQRVIPHPPPPG